MSSIQTTAEHPQPRQIPRIHEPGGTDYVELVEQAPCARPPCTPDNEETPPLVRLLATVGPNLPSLAFPDLVRIFCDTGLAKNAPGRGLSPDEELVRFRHSTHLGFDPAEMTNIGVETDAHGREQITITAAFLGLSGHASPLPNYLPEEMQFEVGDDPVQRDFIDLFHHHLLSLLYRGMEADDVGRDIVRNGPNHWLMRVLALAGLDATEGDHEQQLRLLSLAPALVAEARSAGELQRLLTQHLQPQLANVNISVEEWTGRRAPVDPRQRLQLGSQHARLGGNSVLGLTCPHPGGGITIVVEGIDDLEWPQMLPGGAVRHQLRAIVTRWVDDSMAVEIELRGRANSEHHSLLGQQRLGRDFRLRAHSGVQRSDAVHRSRLG